jgi:hypothetical protein
MHRQAVGKQSELFFKEFRAPVCFLRGKSVAVAVERGVLVFQNSPTEALLEGFPHSDSPLLTEWLLAIAAYARLEIVTAGSIWNARSARSIPKPA